MQRRVPGDTTSGSLGQAAERMGVQGGGVAGDPGATGQGAANSMTDMGSRLAGGASEPSGRDMRPLGTHEMGTGGAPAGAAATGFGGTTGTTATPASGVMGGGSSMQPSSGMQQGGFGGGATSGTAGTTTFTGQGTTGGEAMGGGVMHPTPVDRKQGA